MRRTILAVATILALLLVGGTAQATTTADNVDDSLGGSNYCSLTYPEEYMLQHTAAVTYRAETTKFAATDTHNGTWEDAYWTTGYGHSLASSMCDDRWTPRGYGRSLPSGTRIGTTYYASLSTTHTKSFRGDLGWDIWLEPPGTGTSNAAMAEGGQAHTEIVIIIGAPGQHVACKVRVAGYCWKVSDQHLPSDYDGHPGGWHRIYYQMSGHGTGRVHDLRLSGIIGDAVTHHHVASSDRWYAIDGGAEVIDGSFTVQGYYLGT